MASDNRGTAFFQRFDPLEAIKGHKSSYDVKWNVKDLIVICTNCRRGGATFNACPKCGCEETNLGVNIHRDDVTHPLVFGCANCNLSARVQWKCAKCQWEQDWTASVQRRLYEREVPWCYLSEISTTSGTFLRKRITSRLYEAVVMTVELSPKIEPFLQISVRDMIEKGQDFQCSNCSKHPCGTGVTPVAARLSDPGEGWVISCYCEACAAKLGKGQQLAELTIRKFSGLQAATRG